MFLVPQISADAWLSGIRREQGVRFGSAGVLGAPWVVRHPVALVGTEVTTGRPVLAVRTLTAEHVGAPCVRESSSIRHTSGSQSSLFKRIPMEML